MRMRQQALPDVLRAATQLQAALHHGQRQRRRHGFDMLHIETLHQCEEGPSNDCTKDQGFMWS